MSQGGDEKNILSRGVRVYAPGMACIYGQLFESISEAQWTVCNFKRELPLYADPADVIANIIAGEVEKTSALYLESESFLQNHLPRVDYDILVIESRWLLYKSLLEALDWNRLAEKIAPFTDKEVYFLDVGYPHLGTVVDLCAVRICDSAAIEAWNWKSRMRCELLSLLSKFKKLVYIDSTAVAAYVGYRQALTNQTDHLTEPYRAYLKDILLQEIGADRPKRNEAIITKLTDRVSGKRHVTEFVEGMKQEIAPNDTLLTLRVIIHHDDPLLCPTTLLVSWKSHANVIFDWSKFRIVNGELQHEAIIDFPGRLRYFHSIISFNTLGRYTITVTE